ncbi:hypothetical protein COV11_00945 [Candidatus Woesearchaeota archaeon CG10_big_fil_rev_8_21_14_0_10_30_7]|nr:MAG: hypothetical protein COV11_00945 [Candidatus Woesearchaeota archaeon CG10_big_fil_rev_8_21_14_0_10_30_7]
MKFKLLTILLLAFTLVGTVSAFQLNIDSLELNGVELDEEGITKLSVERGQEVELRLLLTAVENVKDFEIRAFISGYEYNDVDRIEATSVIDDLETGLTYVKTLKLKLSDLIESDEYKLRLVFSDRNNDPIIKKYNIKIDLPRHALKVSDVIFYPSNNVKAGHALLTSVRVENKGEKDEKNVRVTVSIPELKLSASGYINKIETGDEEEETEELYLRLDKCVKKGNYELLVDVSFDNNYRSLEPVRKTVHVEASDACGSTSRSAEVNIISSVEKVKRGTSVVYPITVTNKGRSQQSFTLTVISPNGLTVNVQPSNTVLLSSGKSHTFSVVTTANEDAPLGAQTLSARLNSGDTILQELILTAQVSENETSGDLKNYLETGLLVLLVVLVLIGLLIGLSKLKSKPNDEYY